MSYLKVNGRYVHVSRVINIYARARYFAITERDKAWKVMVEYHSPGFVEKLNTAIGTTSRFQPVMTWTTTETFDSERTLRSSFLIKDEETANALVRRVDTLRAAFEKEHVIRESCV